MPPGKSRVLPIRSVLSCQLELFILSDPVLSSRNGSGVLGLDWSGLPWSGVVGVPQTDMLALVCGSVQRPFLGLRGAHVKELSSVVYAGS